MIETPPRRPPRVSLAKRLGLGECLRAGAGVGRGGIGMIIVVQVVGRVRAGAVRGWGGTQERGGLVPQGILDDVGGVVRGAREAAAKSCRAEMA